MTEVKYMYFSFQCIGMLNGFVENSLIHSGKDLIPEKKVKFKRIARGSNSSPRDVRFKV